MGLCFRRICGLKQGINLLVLYPAPGAIAEAGNRLWHSIRSCSNGMVDQVIFVLVAIAVTAGVAGTACHAPQETDAGSMLGLTQLPQGGTG
jgi:hypothetical protein